MLLITLILSILQIVCEVGMFVITASPVPFDFAVLVPTLVSPKESFFSYNALGLEVIFCDYPKAPRDGAEGFIQHSPILGPACHASKGQGAPRHSLALFRETLRRVKDLQSGPEDYLVSFPCASGVMAVGFPDRQLVILPTCLKGVWVRHNLMMTKPLVRVTLKLSDEGTFGKCRNQEAFGMVMLKSEPPVHTSYKENAKY